MITLKTHSQEEFNEQYIARRNKMRSIMMMQLLEVLTEHAIADKDIDAAELAMLIGSERNDIHKKISNMNNIHGIKVLNKTNTLHKSSYRLIGFFEPEKRKRKTVAKPPSFMFQLSGSDKLINQVFC